MRGLKLWTLTTCAATALVVTVAMTWSCKPGQADAQDSDAPVSALALEEAIVASAEDAVGSVVSIETQVPIEVALGGMMGPHGDMFDNPFAPFFDLPPGWDSEPGQEEEPEVERLTTAGGSGVVHTADGHIVTNAHVIEDAVEIRVILSDGRTLEAEVVGADAESDLAVIKVDVAGLTPVRYADSGHVKPGQFAIAVGMPLGHDYTVTVGHVSAIGRGNIYPSDAFRDPEFLTQQRLSIQSFIQTDASINPGNSGGPLLNLHGEVLGINTIVQGGIGGGFGFAIPAELVQRVASQLIDTGEVSRAWLGVSMTDLTYEKAIAFEVGRNHGALVEQVFPGSPADSVGLKAGDVIVAVDDDEVRGSTGVVYRISSHLAGETIALTYVRGGKEKRVEFEAGERRDGLASSGAGAAAEEPEEEASAQGGKYGMLLRSVTSQDNESLDRPANAKGVLVVEVVPSSIAHRAGVRAGDVILDVDGKAVRDPAGVVEALGGATKEYVPLTVERGGDQRFVAMKRIAE